MKDKKWKVGDDIIKIAGANRRERIVWLYKLFKLSFREEKTSKTAKVCNFGGIQENIKTWLQ